MGTENSACSAEKAGSSSAQRDSQAGTDLVGAADARSTESGDHIADLRFTPPPATNAPKLPVPPATTIPIKVDGPEDKGAQLPQTVSTNSSEDSTAHVLSISSIPLRADSLVILPPANQVALSGNGQGQGSGEGAGAGEASGTSTQPAPGRRMPNKRERLSEGMRGLRRARGARFWTLAGGAGTAALGSAGFGSAGEGLATEAMHRIARAKDGKFSVVVIGSSAAEAYPDSIGLMTGKVIYTVYLKVGLHKSWILQYCLPGPVEQQLRVKGSATPLDAPWPFLMLRPDLANSDALMLHGFVNTDGRFEKLALVLPVGFPQNDLLVPSLRQWEFRPAKDETAADRGRGAADYSGRDRVGNWSVDKGHFAYLKKTERVELHIDVCSTNNTQCAYDDFALIECTTARRPIIRNQLVVVGIGFHCSNGVRDVNGSNQIETAITLAKGVGVVICRVCNGIAILEEEYPVIWSTRRCGRTCS